MVDEEDIPVFNGKLDVP